MIYTNSTITVSGENTSIDRPVVLYRGDYEVEIRFYVMKSPFYQNLLKTKNTNLVSDIEASFGQLIINVPNSKPIFSDVTPVESDGAIIFTIKKEMIDESIELGEYDFQIRLFDENQQSRATIPPVIKGIKIKEPIASEDEVNVAQVNYTMLSTSTSTPLDSFDSNGNYIETSWKDRDLITDGKLNKIEKALTGINNKTKDIEGSIPTKTSQLTNDSGYVTDTEMRTVIENKDTIYNSRLTDIETKNTEQDNRLDIAENRLDNISNDITNTMQPIIDAHTSRLDTIEAIDVAQNNRLDAIEVKNQQQDDRLLDIEKANKRQDMDLKCLFTEAKNNMIDVTDEGNSIYLQNSTTGHVFIDEIKGNTLVNCNKEPDKELILNGNINTSGDNSINITEGVDGGKVDVYLEGNTLVNVSKTKDSTALPLDEELTYLYANTQYTVQFVSDKAITADITLGGTSLLAKSITKGFNKILITTPSELVDNKLIINGAGAKISDVVVTDTNREFSYFEGMKSVGECEELDVRSNNKNLFDTSLLKPISDKTTYGYYRFNPHRVNMTLSITDKDPSVDISELYIGFTGNAKDGSDGYDWLINMGEPVSTKSITQNMRYISFYPNEQSTLDKLFARFNFQLEEGSTATDYIPHQSNIQQLTHEPLRAVENTKDRYVLIDGKWYIRRKCGSATFDGSDDENWIIDNQGGDNGDTSSCSGFKIEIDDIVNIPNGWGDVKLKCDLFQHTMTYDRKINGINYGWGKFIYIKFDRYMSIDEFRNYLKTNPLEVVYPLGTPIHEPLEYNPLEVYSEVTHISTNSTIPTNITVKNTGFNCLLKPSTTYTISSNLRLNTVTTGADIGDGYLRFMDTDTSDVTTMKDVLVLEGDWTTKADLIPANFSGIESAFEQEYDEEKGKYKVTAKVTNEDKTKENNITFYINESLRGTGDVRDKVFIKDDKVVVQRNYGVRAYEDGDFGTYITDKVNTVYPLAEPTYEEIDYIDNKLYMEIFNNSTLFYNSNVPVTSKVHYSYSVPLVDKVSQTADTVAQTANVTDQQDQLIIDLATQCAVMEMYLM